MRHKSKKAFTLAESLISTLIVSAVGVSAIFIVNAYMKNTYQRDLQTKVLIQNVNIIENLKENVDTIPKLYDFLKGMDLDTYRLVKVGVGEVKLNKDPVTNEINVIQTGNNESFGFSSRLRPTRNDLFRLELHGKVNGEVVENSKLITILLVE